MIHVATTRIALEEACVRVGRSSPAITQCGPRNGSGMSTKRIAGVILAGGNGRRIGGNKPLRPLRGRPLIESVISRTRPQVDTLWLSANRKSDGLKPLGLPIVDDGDDHAGHGPLAGIAAALSAAQANGFDYLAVVPCDAPFIPPDLVARLARSLDAAGAPGAVVRTPRGLQPTFGLWSVEAHESCAAALNAGRLRLGTLCSEIGMATLWCGEGADEEDGFFNINTRSDLVRAESTLDRLLARAHIV